ncbi:MAG: hypothetical protein KBA66_01330 [Leptospiraceae bacterium]|nr:hypothetical protein [Leptospiraceae bacterium]
MRLLRNYINELKVVYPISGYLLLLAALVFFKVKIYNYNLSAMIGIWKGFAILNSDLMETGFVIYDEGGYDGQFFFFLAKSLFTFNFEKFPILDSFNLRFNRIGLPLLSGVFCKFLGFNHYSLITLCILSFSHIYSFLILNKMLAQKNKYLAYFHLFSPITLNANLLLVSDSLFVSFSIFCVYFIKHLGVNIFTESSMDYKKKNISYILFDKSNFPFSENFGIPKRQKHSSVKSEWVFSFGVWYILFFFMLLFMSFIRETGLILLATFFLICIYDKKIKVAIPVFLSILSYITITQIFKYSIDFHPGTNPLSFIDLIDYPLFGFYKSIQLNAFTDIRSLLRELAKFPIFIFYVVLILNLKNINTIRDLIVYMPLFFILLVMGVGEEGYWLSFDNISRMLSLSIPWIILLKNKNDAHNDYYSMYVSIFILILLIIRLVYIKSPMKFAIY